MSIESTISEVPHFLVVRRHIVLPAATEPCRFRVPSFIQNPDRFVDPDFLSRKPGLICRSDAGGACSCCSATWRTCLGATQCYSTIVVRPASAAEATVCLIGLPEGEGSVLPLIARGVWLVQILLAPKTSAAELAVPLLLLQNTLLF